MKIKQLLLVTAMSVSFLGCKTRAYNNDDSGDSDTLSLATEELVKKVVRYADSNADNIIKAFNSGDTELGLKLLESSEGNSVHVLGLVSKRAKAMETFSKRIDFMGTLPESVQKQLPKVLEDLGEDVTRASAIMERMGYPLLAKQAKSNASSMVRTAAKEFKVLSASLKATYGSVNNIEQFAASTVLGKFATNSAEMSALGAAIKNKQKSNLMYSVYAASEEAHGIYVNAIKNAPDDFKATAKKLFNQQGTKIDLTGEFFLFDPFAAKINNESLPRLTESMSVPTLDKGAGILHNDIEAAQRGINPRGFKERGLKEMVCTTEEFLTKASKIVKITGGASYARATEQMLKTTLNAYKSVKIVKVGGKELYQVGSKQMATAMELNTWLAQSAGIVR